MDSDSIQSALQYVTTSNRMFSAHVKRAKEIAEKLSIQYLPRKRLSKERRDQGPYYLVKGDREMLVYPNSASIFPHPGLFRSKVKTGDRDPLFRALMLVSRGEEIQSIWDMNAGLGRDSLLLSQFSKAHVTCFEIEPVLAELLFGNVLIWRAQAEPWAEPASRLEVICADQESAFHKTSQRPDIIYFDPMMRTPRGSDQTFDAFRDLANHNPVLLETIQNAREHAKMGIIIKRNKLDRDLISKDAHQIESDAVIYEIYPRLR